MPPPTATTTDSTIAASQSMPARAAAITPETAKAMRPTISTVVTIASEAMLSSAIAPR